MGTQALLPARRKDVPAKPQNWGKAVAAAYFRIQGAPQKVAAEAAGVGERTLEGWEKSDWWPEAKREADARFMGRLTEVSRRTLFQAIKKHGRADLALSVLERVHPALAPAKAKGLPDDDLMRDLAQAVVEVFGPDRWSEVEAKWVEILTRRVG